MKQVQITVPYEKTEAVFEFLSDGLHVKNIMKFNADNAIVLQFRISDDSVNETIAGLRSRGVGVDYGFVDILDLRTSLPRDSEVTKEDKIHREATLAVEEIYENVKKQASLSFDYMAFVILAAIMAGFGLVQNNGTVIVASMLLSPLMGPMLGVALGYVIHDRKLFIKGTKNEMIGILLSLAVGVGIALVMPLLQPDIVSTIVSDVEGGIITEITRRGSIVSIDIGVAIFSGAAVAVSITRGDMSSLVGVAISASLMPPAVNAAMMTILGLAISHTGILAVGAWSFLLLCMNIIVIDLAAIVMFRVKKLSSIADRSATWKAVTQFKITRSDSLYHHPKNAKKSDEAIPGSVTDAETNAVSDKSSNDSE